VVSGNKELPMFRTQMPRIYELRDLIPDPRSPDAYFQNFDENVQDFHVRQIYARWETELQGLDEDAWEFLKCEASPYLIHKDRSGRGWQQLFDILNQARGYNYLKAIGSSNVRFIPRAKSSARTPDLEGVLDLGRVFCEVKTINITQKEVCARKEFTVREISTCLDDWFLRKLHLNIMEAKDQLDTYMRRARGDSTSTSISALTISWESTKNSIFVRSMNICQIIRLRESTSYFTMTTRLFIRPLR